MNFNFYNLINLTDILQAIEGHYKINIVVYYYIR